MRCSTRSLALVLGAIGIAAQAQSQGALATPIASTNISSIPIASITSRPDFDLRQNSVATCGYVDGDPSAPITCPGDCGFILMLGQEYFYGVCCENGRCEGATTCIERSSTNDPGALICTGSSSACATYLWPSETAIAYKCATSRSTITLSINSTKTSSSISSQFTRTATRPTTGAPLPTATAGTPPPGLGSESGLGSRRDRLSASIGSGILGGALLGAFILFGCWFNPPVNEEEEDTGEVEQPVANPLVQPLYYNLQQ